MILVSHPSAEESRFPRPNSICAMHVFKRLNRFIRFVICVVRPEITDLTEYQDTTIGVVVYRPRALLPPASFAGPKSSAAFHGAPMLVPGDTAVHQY
jgi:hypothetical protein